MDTRGFRLASESDLLHWDGRTYTGSRVGFGRLWLKTYQVWLAEERISPESVIEDWRVNFFQYWPEGGKPVERGLPIETGEAYVIRIATPFGLSLETGFTVISVTQDSFILMTRSDHPFSGWIHFSARAADGGVIAQTQALVRPRDPLWEIAFRLGVLPKAEDDFWKFVLSQLSEKYSSPPNVNIGSSLLDPQVQWRQVKQLLKNRPARYGFGVLAAVCLTVLTTRLGKMQKS